MLEKSIWQGTEIDLQPNNKLETEVLSPITCKELNPGGNHMSLESDAPSAEPSHETPAMADSWIVALCETLKQRTQLCLMHRN